MTASKPFWVGAFVLGGVAIAIGAIIWLGSANIFAKRNTHVTYIDGSVQGLNVDAEVKFRGVTVGRVSGVRVAPDGKLIEVIMDLDPDFKVEPDVRAKLNYTGITGLKYVDLSFVEPDKLDRHPHLTFKPAYPVIPSQPGGLEEVEESLKDVYDMLVGIDTEGISRRTTEFLDAGTRVAGLADSLLRSPEVARTLNSLARAAGRVDSLFEAIDTRGYDARVDSTLVELHQGARDFRRLMAVLEEDAGEVRLSARTDSLFRNINSLVSSTQELVSRSQYTTFQMMNQLGGTITELNSALEQLNSLMISLESYPSHVLYTAPPPKEK